MEMDYKYLFEIIDKGSLTKVLLNLFHSRSIPQRPRVEKTQLFSQVLKKCLKCYDILIKHAVETIYEKHKNNLW